MARLVLFCHVAIALSLLLLLEVKGKRANAAAVFACDGDF